MAAKYPDEPPEASCEICAKCRHSSLSQPMTDRFHGHMVTSLPSTTPSDTRTSSAAGQSLSLEHRSERSKAKVCALSKSEAIVLEKESLTKQLELLRSLVKKMREEAQLNEPRLAAAKRLIHNNSMSRFK